MALDAASRDKLSVIITSYNQLPVLRMLLASLRRQTVQGFEVVIADDGSSDGTAEYCATQPVPRLLFVTQADDGYRKSRILNEALHRASGEYLIFLDSDVILERHFIEDHLGLREPGGFVCGRRVDLGPAFTAKLTEPQVAAGAFDRIVNPALLLSSLQGDTKGVKRAFRVVAPWLRGLMGYHRPIDILGSNLGVWRKDLLEINGFNEALEAYWGEDGDLFIRLRNCGKKAINAKGLCVQYHVFHKRREPTLENVEKVTKLLQNSEYKWAEKGYRSRFAGFA